jgi:hypothetical protein
MQTTNPTWTDLGLCGERPAINHLHQGMALKLIESHWHLQNATIGLVLVHVKRLKDGWEEVKLTQSGCDSDMKKVG